MTIKKANILWGLAVGISITFLDLAFSKPAPVPTSAPAVSADVQACIDNCYQEEQERIADGQKTLERLIAQCQLILDELGKCGTFDWFCRSALQKEYDRCVQSVKDFAIEFKTESDRETELCVANCVNPPTPNPTQSPGPTYRVSPPPPPPNPSDTPVFRL